MTETTTDFIVADINKPLDTAEVLRALAADIECDVNDARIAYNHIRKMNDSSFISMRETDKGFLRGYWMGLHRAVTIVNEFLRDTERQNENGKKENENAGA